MVNVPDRHCDHPSGCYKQPSFGVVGGFRQRCAAHREDGMVNVTKFRLLAGGGVGGGERPAAKRRRTVPRPALTPGEQLQRTVDLPAATAALDPMNAAGSSNWTEAELWQMLHAAV